MNHSTIGGMLWQRVFFGGVLLGELLLIVRREIPFGLEDRTPAFVLRGFRAVAMGIALALVGLAGMLHGNVFP